MFWPEMSRIVKFMRASEGKSKGSVRTSVHNVFFFFFYENLGVQFGWSDFLSQSRLRSIEVRTKCKARIGREEL